MDDRPARIFGVIVAGRLIQADFIQASETEFVTEVPDAGSINHVVVFLTGVSPFPDGVGGTVYIRWPKLQSEANWHYLGFISNEKPSAIFRVAQLHKTDAMHEGVFTSMGLPSDSRSHGVAQIGISVEPLQIIQEKVPAVTASPSQQTWQVEYSQKMLTNFINYATSFVVRMPRPDSPSDSADFIPVSVIQCWYTNFCRRLEQNPDFWKSLQ